MEKITIYIAKNTILQYTEGEVMNVSYSLSTNYLPHYWFSGYKNFAPGEIHLNRTCPHDVLLLIYQGVLHFTENGIPVTLKPGEYYIQRKGLFQESNRVSTAKYYFIHFHGKWLENDSGLPIRGHLDFSVLEPLCRKLEFLQFVNASALETNGVFYTILSHLLEKQEPVKQKKVIQQIIEMVGRNPAVPVSLQEMAEKYGYSQNQLINLFKKETGQSPMAYITALRIRAAKRQLTYSQKSMKEIAHTCGFGSYINFYKAFVKSEGCSPLDWCKEQMVRETQGE